jgi:hypothetical protein
MEHADGIRVVNALRVTRCRPSSTPPWPVSRVGNGYRRFESVGHAVAWAEAIAIVVYVGVLRE